MSEVIFTIQPIKQADFTIVPTSVNISVGQNAPVNFSVNPTGAKGQQGVQGVTGLAGGSFTHNQSTANTVWNIPHNLGFYPNVSVMDSSNRKVLTDINYVDQNNLQVIIANAFSGIAYLS